MAVIENCVVFAIGLLDLVQTLGDEESAHAIAGHEGETGFEEVEPSERRKLVEHHQQLMARRVSGARTRSEEHTSELQSLMRISYAVFCLKKKKQHIDIHNNNICPNSNSIERDTILGVHTITKQ